MNHPPNRPAPINARTDALPEAVDTASDFADLNQPASDPSCCTHCGLFVPPGLRQSDADKQFCCSGCRTVHYALLDNGLLSYYDKRAPFAREEDLGKGPAKPTEQSFAHFDDPGFLQTYTTEQASLREVEFFLEGMHCPACIWLVEKLPNVLDGVAEARSNFSEGRIRILWDPTQVVLSKIAQTLDSLGYPPHPAGQGRSLELRRKVDRALLIKIGVAAATFANVMLLSFALYSGEFQGMHPALVEFFRWTSFVISVPSVLWTGSTFFKGGWAALRTRTPHMDLPVSIGILAALGWGTHATLSGRGEIYFDTVTMLVFLLLIGRWLQSRQQRAANEATDLMFALAPSTSRLVEGDEKTQRQVPTDSVPVGALVEVLSGERIGIDGLVVEGDSKVDESLLNGESQSVRAQRGSRVCAGTINLSARLLVRATRTGRDTRLAHLIKEVEAAAERKAPIVLLADRLSGVFVLTVIALAALTLAMWGVEAGLPHAIALLIVSCPCALGLATPLAASVALGRAAKGGILVKGMQYLELLAKPGLIVFDKTGTLTSGKLSVVDFDGDAKTAALVRAAEQASAHPIAKAVARDLPLTSALQVSNFAETQGGGVRAQVEGRDVLVGSARFITESLRGDTPFDAESMLSPSSSRVAALLERGLSPLFVVVDGALTSVLGLGDPLRPDAQQSLQRLHDLGYRLAICSGDRTELVESIARQLTVHFDHVLGEQSPEQKLSFVESQRNASVVYMVGDGVNDAAALAAASVGIAVHGGAEASLAAADVFTTVGGLAPVLELTRGARATLRVIHRNLGFSLLYNVIAAGLAITGLITPLVAAVLMPLSSLTVLASSFRAHTFGTSLPPPSSNASASSE